MVSVVPRSFSMPSPSAKQELQLNELGSLTDAVEPFARLLSQTGRSVRLHCSVPMWSYPSDTCLDLHDLHDLRSRILLFVHDLLESLRSAGCSKGEVSCSRNSAECEHTYKGESFIG
ncbi:hypothetical protein BDR03DRAFT_9998 [Suillus americanus]|nr:hypothetical protein BDR03DRAFT_9998 [Suillus americanus]